MIYFEMYLECLFLCRSMVLILLVWVLKTLHFMLKCATTLKQTVWEATLVPLWRRRRQTVMCCNNQMVYN